jgi:benzoyl-CoA reductase subunit D
MITAGIDCGARLTKVVLLQGGRVLARAAVTSGFDPRAAAEAAWEQALRQAEIGRDQVDYVVSTGVGRKEVPFADEEVTEVTADARAVWELVPSARTILDIGAEEGRSIQCDDGGRVVDFAMNEKCAAGAGTFVETMARALEVPLEEMGPLSLKSQKAIPMNAQCTVFAESEVVSLIHQGVAKADIIRAVHDAMADRCVAMARRSGIAPEVVLVGGVGYNAGMVAALERELGMEVTVPEHPEYVSALGAALLGEDRLKNKREQEVAHE